MTDLEMHNVLIEYLLGNIDLAELDSIAGAAVTAEPSFADEVFGYTSAAGEFTAEELDEHLHRLARSTVQVSLSFVDPNADTCLVSGPMSSSPTHAVVEKTLVMAAAGTEA